MEENKDFLWQGNNYRSLKTFQKAECIYDVTFYFAHKYLASNDRTVDQMVQAARSGKQNLAEGNIDGITSREMELKLTNVNRASLIFEFAGWSNGDPMTLAASRHGRFAKSTWIRPFIVRRLRSVQTR